MQSFSFAYNWGPYTPGTTSFTFKTHSSLNSTATNAAIAAPGVWSKFKFTYGFGSSGAVSSSDSRSDVCMLDFVQAGFPSTATGAAIFGSDYYEYFDIALNARLTWGDGSSGSYHDYRGFLTHEFGHVIGLGDVYSGTTASNVPTMYAYSKIGGIGNIIGYYFRTLQTDDINGMNASYNMVN
jgi:hypothetical protein